MREHIKSSGWSGGTKRAISLFLVVAMMVSLLPAIPFFSAVSANAAGESKTITVYFNDLDGWSSVYGYIWDANGKAVVEWPGTRLSQDSDGLYKLTYSYVPEGSNKFNFIFNNNAGSQTGDLTISNADLVADQVWLVNGPDGRPAKYAIPTAQNGKVTFTYKSSSASTVLLAGSMNDWKGVTMSKSGDTFSHTYDLEPGKYEYKFVADGDWTFDPGNPQIVGNDRNSYIVVSGLKKTEITIPKGATATLPAELTCVGADGSEYLTGVTYSVPSGISDYVTIDGHQITVSSTYTASSVDLTATSAGGDRATLTVHLDANMTSTCVKVHFLNNLGWETVNAYAWENGTPVNGKSWPGQTVFKDADGFYTLELEYYSVSRGDLGLIFHNGNGSQTADMTISGSRLASGNVELWAQPDTSAGEDGKYPCSLVTSPSALFLSPEIKGDQVTFRYKNSSASTVHLAGSFNDWSITDHKMTESNGVWSITLTLDAGVYEYKFVVDGSKYRHDPNNLATGGFDGNSIVVVPDENATNTGKVTVMLHFYRENGDYKNWDVWMWGNQGDAGCAFTDDPSGKGKVASFTVDGDSNSKVGFKVRKTDWSDQEFENDERSVDISNVVSGTVHYYVTSGVYAGSKILGPDVVMGGKLTYARLNYDTGKIKAKTSMPISGTLSSAFSIVTGSGAPTDITVTGVSVVDGDYVLTLSRKMELWEVYDRKVKVGGLSVGISIEGVFGSDQFAADFTYHGDDLGATWTEEMTTFKVWAPTATNVIVKLYKSGNDGANDLIRSVSMTRGEKGVWTAMVPGDLNGTYYTYQTTVNGGTEENIDPYARSAGINGKRGLILDMDLTDPEGWNHDSSPNYHMSYTDAIIYEMHVREFTIDKSSGVKDGWRGKYLGLTQEGTNYQGRATGLDHLKELGVTHVQLMPIADFHRNSVDEKYPDDHGWAYDPHHFIVPEGSYSLDPENGEVRVNEVKQMVQTFHDNGINVVMDVVFNHAADGGAFCYDDLIPYYFYRFYGDYSWSNRSDGSGCGNDIATERSMVRKYIIDSVMYWVEEYHIDGFRFDIMGLMDTETINQIIDTVHAKYPDVIFYGEGWYKDNSTAYDGRYSLANQGNAWKTPDLAHYNDTFRDAIPGKEGDEYGYAIGHTDKIGTVIEGFRAKNGWSDDPNQTINYVSCHDGHTLADKITMGRRNKYTPDEQHSRMTRLSAAMYLMAQGIPMIFSGEEILRSKPDGKGGYLHNTYDSGDGPNTIYWSDLVKKPDAQLTDDYYAGLIAIRRNHFALRFSNTSDIDSNVFHIDTSGAFGNDILMFSIRGDHPYECSDGIVIVYNATGYDKTVRMNDYGIDTYGYQIYAYADKAGLEPISEGWAGGVGEVKVAAFSATILIKNDAVHEESIYNMQGLDCDHSSHGADAKCTACGVRVRHNYEDGKCTICRTTCGHTLSGILCTTCGDVCDHSWNDGTCTDCGLACTHSYKSGECVFCGADRPALDYYLYGYINGKDYGDGGDYNNLGSYKFVDGKLTVRFDTDSYVAVKTSDNDTRFMTDGWLGEKTTSATLYSTFAYGGMTFDKLYVPGGKQIDFTLVVGDDTVTLSYAVVNDPAPEGDYYVAGSEGLVGSFWDEDDPANKMTLVDGLHQITYTDVTPGEYEFKVTNGTWHVAYPEANYILNVETDSDVTIIFDPITTQITVDVVPKVKASVIPTLTLDRPSLSLEDEVLYNVYYFATDTEDVVEMGMITFDSMRTNGTIEDAVEVIPGYVSNGITCMVRSRGIPAANMGDTVYFKVYAKLADGTYAYSNAGGYNAKAYANTVLSGDHVPAMKALAVALLNYGAAAQEYFGYKTNSLMNASLTPEQQALVSAYDPGMITTSLVRVTDKVGSFVSSGGFSKFYPTVSFDGAFAINYYCIPANAPSGEVKMYYWDAETYANEAVLTAENATGVEIMELSVNGEYGAAVSGIAAKELDEYVYVAIVYEANGITYCPGVIAYSLAAYCKSFAGNVASDMYAFSRATVVYGHYAKNYFATV